MSSICRNTIIQEISDYFIMDLLLKSIGRLDWLGIIKLLTFL